MALGLKLTQKMSQNLALTPQLRQALKLLQMGRLDYIEAIQEELMTNPLLEEVGETGSASDTGVNSNPDTPENEVEAPTLLKEDSPLDEVAYLEQFADNAKLREGGAAEVGQERSSVDRIEADAPGLKEYLFEQVTEHGLSAGELAALDVVIGNLNADGHLDCSLSELSNEALPLEQLTKAQKLLQTLDPAGIGAGEVRECLLLQLRRLGKEHSLAARIVEHHLDRLGARQYKQIAKAENQDLKDVLAAAQLVQQLDPWPARNFSNEVSQYVVPDVYVYEHEGELRVSVNDDGLPRLRVSNYYLQALQRDLSSESRQFISERLKAATWFLRSIQQRQQTIIKVAECLVNYQEEFFRKGVESLKPLTLKQIAKEVDLHESTISRVTSNKYLHSDRGVFELKYFFTTGLSCGGGEISTASVKDKIRQIIAAEDPRKPVSDQKIVEMLGASDITIARRTVAKYRESLGFLASSKRKRLVSE